MGDTLISPRTEHKIRSTLLQNPLKNKSPHFKDILRERFRSRVKANRRALFQKMRELNDENEAMTTISSILQTEVNYFTDKTQSVSQIPHYGFDNADKNENVFDEDAELKMMNEIYEELIEEQMAWICEEIRKEDEQIASIMDDQTLCPLCQRGILKDIDGSAVMCTGCNFHLSTPTTVAQLDSTIKQYVVYHSNMCNEVPEFCLFKETDLNGLFLICHNCLTFNQLC